MASAGQVGATAAAASTDAGGGTTGGDAGADGGDGGSGAPSTGPSDGGGSGSGGATASVLLTPSDAKTLIGFVTLQITGPIHISRVQAVLGDTATCETITEEDAGATPAATISATRTCANAESPPVVTN